MFTGLVEELGELRERLPTGDGARLRIGASRVLEGAALGDSIAVDGCCLTVVELGEGWWAADAVPETLARTTLGDRAPGDAVNLERPLRADGRFGGHIVQGHVDATTELVERRACDDGSWRLRFALPPAVDRYVVEKGSIAIDGVSLTVAAVDERGGTFEIALIPHTHAVTTLGRRRPGDRVNVEADILAKYVERLVTASGKDHR
ncbi:MAG: riboflavin synthase [Actinomyces sp.]|nr:MAG: riboflavin synthase [Actinomyces sp.]